jgi:Cu/Ag efflux protein CusF
MKRIIIAAASVLALAAGAARATDDKSATGANAPSKGTSSSATPGTGTAGTTATGNTTAGTSTAGTSASADLPAVGDVKATDPAAMVITIVLPSGDEQQLSVANDAVITRDGDKASLGQVQQGDNVRASFDPSSHKVSKVDVRSKSSKATDKSTKSKSNDSSKSDDAQKK